MSPAAAQAAVMDWHGVKLWLEHASGLDMDALHVHAGVGLQIVAALVLRRPLRSPWPWLVLLSAELANETYDYNYEIWPDRSVQMAEGIRDLWNTMLIPTAILLTARYFPSLVTGRRKPAETQSGADPG